MCCLVQPVVLECIADEVGVPTRAMSSTKAMYRLSEASRELIKGCQWYMCSTARYKPDRVREMHCWPLLEEEMHCWPLLRSVFITCR
jgi:hypothetical protein